MPRSMADANYRYNPWTPERRRAASEAAKRRWQERREREASERLRERHSMTGQLRDLRWAKQREMQEIGQRWHKLKAEVEQLDKATNLLAELKPILSKFRIATASEIA